MNKAGSTARRLPPGFTLLELMVAAGVGTTVVLLVLSVMISGSESYAAATARIDTNVEARAALTAIRDDLATVRYSDTEEGSFSLRHSPDPWPLSELWFLALKPRRAQEAAKASGDLCFVYYYTAVTNEFDGTSGPVSRKLYRRLVSSAEVMEKLRAGEDFRNPQPDPMRLEDEAIAFNVLQFLVEPKRIDPGTGRPGEWSRSLGGRPVFVDVTLRVTDDRTAALLDREADWRGEGPLARDLLGEGTDNAEGKRTRTYRIRLPFDD